MTSSEAASPGSDSTVGTGTPLPFDTSVAHQARVYDYMLGGSCTRCRTLMTRTRSWPG